MKLRVWVWVALTLTGGCGGGDSDGSTATVTRVTAAQLRTTLGTQLRVAATASPAQAAEQLLDYAETTFPTLFPSRQATATLDPFLYRYHPQTGVYVGVVVKANMGYMLDGVYVMGGPFGDAPVYVGQIGRFIAPVNPGAGTAGPAGPNNGCYDLALFETVGTRIERTMQSVGSSKGVVTEVLTINGERTFEGHTAVETHVRRTGTLSGVSSVTQVDSDEKRYQKRTGEFEVTRYGFESTNYTSSESRIVRTRFATERQYGLAVGESVIQSVTGTTTTISPSTKDTPQTTAFVRQETVKFVGREQVTTPSNTYSTCKFTTTYADQDGANANVEEMIWVIDGKGIVVKMQLYFKGQRFVTDEATSVKLNGQNL